MKHYSICTYSIRTEQVYVNRGIGNAIKPYYGEAADNQLTVLLKDHIVISADVVAAAKAND
jgi:hypothetical protein